MTTSIFLRTCQKVPNNINKLRIKGFKGILEKKVILLLLHSKSKKGLKGCTRGKWMFPLFIPHNAAVHFSMDLCRFRAQLLASGCWEFTVFERGVKPRLGALFSTDLVELFLPAALPLLFFTLLSDDFVADGKSVSLPFWIRFLIEFPFLFIFIIFLPFVAHASIPLAEHFHCARCDGCCTAGSQSHCHDADDGVCWTQAQNRHQCDWNKIYFLLNISLNYPFRSGRPRPKFCNSEPEDSRIRLNDISLRSMYVVDGVEPRHFEAFFGILIRGESLN